MQRVSKILYVFWIWTIFVDYVVFNQGFCYVHNIYTTIIAIVLLAELNFYHVTCCI